jgi:hypothetical protein
MAFEEGRDTLICEHCGAKHKARWYRLPVREEQSIRCKACGDILRQGKSIRDYFNVELCDVEVGSSGSG